MTHSYLCHIKHLIFTETPVRDSCMSHESKHAEEKPIHILLFHLNWGSARWRMQSTVLVPFHWVCMTLRGCRVGVKLAAHHTHQVSGDKHRIMPHIRLIICPLARPSIPLSVSLSVCVSVCLSTPPSVRMFVWPSVACLVYLVGSLCVSVCVCVCLYA